METISHLLTLLYSDYCDSFMLLSKSEHNTLKNLILTLKNLFNIVTGGVLLHGKKLIVFSKNWTAEIIWIPPHSYLED